MSTSFNAVVDVGRVDVENDADAILKALAGYHAVLAGTRRGTVEAIVTLPAETLAQAATTALAVVAAAGGTPQSLQVMTTEEFDRRAGLAEDDEDLSVPQAAKRLRVTQQAIRQRLASGSLPGRRVGRDWRIPAAAVERVAAQRDALQEFAAATVLAHGGDPSTIKPESIVVQPNTYTMSFDR
ncbi:helix-turn-helix domain-containing protein [Cellulomonas oligotrophica]|uniref:Excisionase family DNA binding protein n=1 Tax=Cellulomonas oligotrophica TaxID=931536 RepID=A0A7Y9FI54_9CELL|nr:helix-turn-helix domain-containing protein [Cellulomonas oligotrophica]NYD87760.1 excisionase family DNA binding protein [Cellulomonas oligotrophica]GIG33035.1 hypothetical protein Col01nite_21940 [Cellulomonas oligotrophica]